VVLFRLGAYYNRKSLLAYTIVSGAMSVFVSADIVWSILVRDYSLLSVVILVLLSMVVVGWYYMFVMSFLRYRVLRKNNVEVLDFRDFDVQYREKED